MPQMMLRTTFVLFVTFLVLVVGGCAVGGGGGVLRASDEPYVLPAIGPVEIDVESFNGNVVIEADEFAEFATVKVVRAVTHGYTSPRALRRDLEKVNYSIQMRPGDIGPRLEVRTMTDHPEPHYYRAHLHITVPEAEGIRVRTSNGNVTARGVSGPIDIETTRGDVRVMTRLPMHQSVRIVNENGNIDYRVRAESTGRINAETVSGRVVHRVRRGHFTINSGTGERRLFATLNRGENPIVLRTMRGDIRVAVVQNPEDMIGTYFFD